MAAAAAKPVSMEATLAPSRVGLSCRGTEGPTRAVKYNRDKLNIYTSHTGDILYFPKNLREIFRRDMIQSIPVGLYGVSSELFLFFDRDLKMGLSSSDSREG